MKTTDIIESDEIVSSWELFQATDVLFTVGEKMLKPKKHKGFGIIEEGGQAFDVWQMTLIIIIKHQNYYRKHCQHFEEVQNNSYTRLRS